MRFLPVLLGWGLLLLVSPPARAHPVAFEGSVGIMGYHSPGMADMEFNYSVRRWLAPSFRFLRYTAGTSKPDVLLANVNFLAHRWNAAKLQANVYVYGGGGHSSLRGGGRGVYDVGFVADAENRRLYFLTEGLLVGDGHGVQATFWKLRGGFAPYVADFDGLHTWLLLEVRRAAVNGKGPVDVIPTLRFFYENVLWEIGASLRGDLNFNYIIHL